MPYNRTLSPGGRRLTDPARASDSNFDPYYSQRHSVYGSPRNSTDRVIPMFPQTYVKPPSTSSASTSSTRLTPGYDAYLGRHRRSSMLENTRSGVSVPAPPRKRPTAAQEEVRPSSPPRRSQQDYFIQPASSKEPEPSRHFEHKKVYSVDEGSAKLVTHVDLGSGGESHHRRRESGDRLGYRTTGYGRGRKPYHSSGKSQMDVDDENAFSYTDLASMYKDTEPRWLETRPRRGSVDRGGSSRERPVSVIESYGADPRRSTRETGPPPSQRGWDNINDLGRSRSTRDPVPQSLSRGSCERDESHGRYSDDRDPYYIAPRKSSADRSRAQAVCEDRPAERYDHEHDDRREPRHHQGRLSVSGHKDRSVSRRGYEISSDSKDRYGTRGSDESFETRTREAARDSRFADSNRRDAPTEPPYSERGAKHQQESKHKAHGRSYEDYDRDSDRDRPRKDRDADRDGYRERQHHRRDSEHNDKKEGDDSFSGAAKIAAGGLGAAATLFGLSRERSKNEEREREEGGEQDRPREQERQRESERPREQPPPQPPRPQSRPYNRELTSDRDSDRPHDAQHTPNAPTATNDADDDYRRRMERIQCELGLPAQEISSVSDPDRERRRREREIFQAERQGRKANGHNGDASGCYDQCAPLPQYSDMQTSFEDNASQAPSRSTWSSAPTNNGEPDLRRRASVLDSSMDAGLMAQVIDNSQSEKRENRVRIVDPPPDEEDRRPKGILKMPPSKFPEDPNAVREGVAPLKDVCLLGRGSQ